MNVIKFFLACLIAATCGVARAQTTTTNQELEIDSDSGMFDGMTNRMVYIGHVFVTDHTKAKLTCARLTVDLPPNGGNPTNIVAETSVVVDVLDSKGQTNHITADRAVYSYSVAGAVTNEIVTFSGNNPKLESPKAIVNADPMIFDVVKKSFTFPRRFDMHLKQTSTGTNASPFEILK